MIQRIQSIWLLLITASLIAVLFLPIGHIQLPSGMYECTAFALIQGGAAKLTDLPVWLIGYGASLGAVISFVTVFLFKKRKLQLLFCKINALLLLVLLGGQILIFQYFTRSLSADVSYGPAVLMPIIGLILSFLAIKAIKKDDALVKSWDRIRG
jgi:hypothetical protein